MNSFLISLFTASIHGSVVILAVLLLRLILRKTPRKFICLLWLLAGIRLLMPIEIQSKLSLQPSLSLPAEAIPERAWVLWVWAVVAVCFGIYSLISYTRLKRKVVDAVRIRGGWESDRIETAFILGFIKPKIYIPMGMSKGSRKHILEHERTHLDKGDHWIKMIGFLALALHWFNPLVWIAYLLLCRDIEMACDERVVQFMELEERKSYSAALLSCSSNQMHFAASPVAFGEVSVTKRIHSILNYKKPSFWISLLGVVSFFFVAVCLLTNPGKEPSDITVTEPQVQQEENEWLKTCREDLEKALSRDTFCCRVVEASGVGYANLYKKGNDTIWTILPLTTMKPEEGRMVLDGQTYAYLDGSWMKTEVKDILFQDWLTDFRWEPEEAVFYDAKTDAYGLTLVEFQVKRNGKLENFTCHYREGIGLETIMVKKDGDRGVILSSLYFDDRNPVLSTGLNAEEAFAEAKDTIVSGTATMEILEEQEEFREWGVHFRVDDDRLTGTGSDVALGQSPEGRGVLRTTDQYWIEKMNDSNWERIPTVTDPNWQNADIGIPRETSLWGYLDWSGIYGTLGAGEYRMGINIQCTDQETNYSRNHTFYSEFTLVETVDSSSPEAAAAVERCYSAWEELANREYIHIKSFHSKTQETWIHGSDYLTISEFQGTDMTPQNEGRVDIMVRKDGIGYSQVRENEEIWGSKVIGMKLHTLNAQPPIWGESFREDFGASFFQRSNKTAVFMEDTGVISDEMVRFDLVWRNAGDTEDCHSEYTYYFYADGNLYRMEYRDPTRDRSELVDEPDEWVEIYDTTVQEIDAKIQSYIENPIVETFSWEDAKAKYTDAEFNIREDGFVNKGGSPITDCIHAARLALKEYPSLGSYLCLTVSRDEDAGMWKVTIQSYVDYQASYGFRDVYLTDDGKTMLLVYEGPLDSEESRK